MFPRGAATLAGITVALWSVAASATPEPLRLTCGDATLEVSPSALGATLADEGSEPSVSSNAVAAVHWDPTALHAACDDLAGDLDLAAPFEGDIDFDGERVVVAPPEIGLGIDCAALALRVEESLVRGHTTLEVPLAIREPRTSLPDLEALARDVERVIATPITLLISGEGRAAGELTLEPDDVRSALRIEVRGDPPRPVALLLPRALEDKLDRLLSVLGEPARDAQWAIPADGATDRLHVVPSRRGYRLDGAALFAAAEDASKKSDKKGTVATARGEPDLTTKKAEALQIKGLVASFTTKYPKGQPRVTNIHRIATLLDGAVVLAGERFSLNRHTGKRTTKRGFVLAPSIGEGEIVETTGGGVSQMATTLYNAVFDAGYAVVSRKPHTRYFDRYPLGVEATLSWPRPDFVFRNDSKAGVLIKASFTDESVTVKLYGDNGGRKVTRAVSKPFAPTDPRIDYEPDDSLPLDKPKVKDAGTKGFSVKAGRDIVFADGTKKHEERVVVYHGRPRVLAAHPCAIPKGEKGHKKKGCPKPEEPPVTTAGDAAQATEKDETKKGNAKPPPKEEAEKAEKKAKSGPKASAGDKGATKTKKSSAKKK